MSDQPTALRLADDLDMWPQSDCSEAAAELRRLHGLDFALRDCELAPRKMATKYMDASDQRDELVEALRVLLNEFHPDHPSAVKARAALAKAGASK